jgi:hypothetical protein
MCGMWVNCSIRAFVRLQVVEKVQDITIYGAKWEIMKKAIVDYIQQPKYAL